MKTDSLDSVRGELQALTDALRTVEDRDLDTREAQRHIASVLRGIVTLAGGVYGRLDRIERLLEKLQER